MMILYLCVLIASLAEARPSPEKIEHNSGIQNSEIPREKRNTYFTYEESSSSQQSSSSSYYRKITSSGPIAKTFVFAGNGEGNTNNFHFIK
ncbi:unnamed protein product [Colias eurytheme]|nr:unnamed protein product [Colias eurytheme]